MVKASDQFKSIGMLLIESVLMWLVQEIEQGRPLGRLLNRLFGLHDMTGRI